MIWFIVVCLVSMVVYAACMVLSPEEIYMRGRKYGCSQKIHRGRVKGKKKNTK